MILALLLYGVWQEYIAILNTQASVKQEKSVKMISEKLHMMIWKE